MTDNSKALLLIFVKHPVAGQSKTRLAAGIGHDKALAVYKALLAHTAAQVATLPQKRVVFYGNLVPTTDLWQAAGYVRQLQEGPDLGARMWQAFRWSMEQGYDRIVVIGSDCPGLTTGILAQAFEQLDHHDAVLGPAKDGGYYLLGLRQPRPEIFLDKTWSTADVAERTRQDLDGLGLSCAELPILNDVDTVEDLAGTFLADIADPAV